MSLTPRLDRLDKNHLINGNFDFWQRGASIASSSNVYIADRWRVDNTQTNTHSQQTSGAPTGSISYWRTVFAASGAMQMFQAVESNFLLPLKGKQATVSFLVKTSGTFSGVIQLRIQKNATADSSIGGTWSNITTLDVTPTASWTKYTVSFTVPDDGTANGLRVNFTTGNTQSAGNIVEFAQVSLYQGELEGPEFTLAGRDYAEELSLCHRYFYRLNAPINFAGWQTTVGWVTSPVWFPTEMRAIPTFSNSGNTTFSVHSNGIFDGTMSAQAFVFATAMTSNSGSFPNTKCYMIGGTCPAVGPRQLNLYANGPSSWMAFDAEI